MSDTMATATHEVLADTPSLGAPASSGSDITPPRAQLVVFLLEAAVVALALDALAAVYRLNQLSGNLLRSHVARADRLTIISARTQLAITLASGVAFLAWSYRATRRHNEQDPEHATPPWFAVACWFVPLVNLIFPPLILKRVLPPGRRVGLVVSAWWATFILANILRLTSLAHPATVSGFQNSDARRLISDGFEIVAAVLLSRLVTMSSSKQR